MLTKVFFSYSPKDGAMRDELVAHLEILRANGKISMWSEQNIQAGDAWREVARREIEAADLVLLLVSADFLASEYCRDTEVRRAWSRHEAGTARVVPIVLRPCLWEEATFSGLKPLPENGRPVTRWEDRDEAWLDVVRGIRTLAKERETASTEAQAATVPTGDGNSATPSRPELQRWLLGPSGPIPIFRDPPPAPLPPREQSRPREQSAPSRQDLERWLLDLEAAHAEKGSVPAEGPEHDKIKARIGELKRKLREGGQLQQGDSLGDGRYYLLHQIGRGGFATVWEADDRKVGKRVAIKVLHPHLASDSTRRERFFRGARAMATTLHPGVVRVLVPYEEDAGFFYFVMELVEGLDLHRAVLLKRIAGDRALSLILQAGEALVAAHRGGFVHRDVSPHNIMLGADGNAKLTDFDLVSAAESTGGTHTGAMGKFLYAPPEVLSRPQDADERADVYGLAMTALFCLHGAELPYEVSRRPERFVEKLRCGPLAPVLLKAIEVEPGERYANMRVFCEALKTASENTVILREHLPASEIEVDIDEPILVSSPAHFPMRVLSLHPHAASVPPLEPASFQQQGFTPEKNGLVPAARSAATSLDGVSEFVKNFPFARLRLLFVVSATLALLGAAAVAARYSSSSSSRCPPGMAFIAAGTFRMGSEPGNSNANDDEHPAHDVTLSAFCLDVAEVTVAKYRACTKEARNGVTCAPAPTTVQEASANSADAKLASLLCNGDRSDRDDHPINCVDWRKADAYCKWAGGTLPTEAQWEYAARGKEGRRYPWGDEPILGPGLLRWRGSHEGGDAGTAPVKSYAMGKTPEGVFDLAGNVWEWVADMKADYSAAPVTDPIQSNGTLRALRGGGWDSNERRMVRAAARIGLVESFRTNNVGFRCARGPNQ